ncbi:MAG: ABC-type probable sulfate transporter, permease protein [Candidatus Jettenia ecosi]|uniref:ABC-type probable sulfate transporter, permease protein n=1 Tax=Candidatus Jettenia ecosi TaxID=2494326 RepID=A0A533QCY6_9BACT|nr:MAG: ABC-type probable sulfate transporter, permease protein [Candidatus Jettenia ecosi]
MYSIFKKVIFFTLLLGIWELLFRLAIWPEYVLPSPISVYKTLIHGFQDQTFLIGIAISMKRIAIGYGISIVIGVLLGLLIGRVRIFEETLGSLISGLQTLPTICWLPLALLWFGLNDKAIIFLVAMGAVLSITIATDAGIKSVPPLYIRAAKTMGARGLNLYFEIILPAALPYIITGMKQGWSFAWRSLMAGELLIVCLGLGHLLMIGRELNDMSQVIAVMIVIIIIGILVDRLFFVKMEKHIRERWGLTKG